MIDNMRTGRNIASHRQKLGLTQGELARRLNVTHQAVSKWENGVAFPDISTLLELSRLFSTSMEALLTGDSSAGTPSDSTATSDAAFAVSSEASAAAETESPVLPSDSPAASNPPVLPEPDASPVPSSAGLTMAQIAALAPFAPRDTLDRLISDNLDSADWDAILSLAPFASKEALDQLILNASSKPCDFSLLSGLAPFLPRETLDRLIENNLDSADWDAVLSLAPFASKDTLDRLVLHVSALPCDFSLLPGLAPFLPRETLDRLIENNLDSADWDAVLCLAPFASKDTLDRLVLNASSKPCDFSLLSGLAPFLRRDTLDRLIEANLNSADWDAVLCLAPFASREALDRLVLNASSSPCDFSLLPGLAPFLHRDTLDRLIEANLATADWDSVLCLAPFASKEMFERLLVSVGPAKERRPGQTASFNQQEERPIHWSEEYEAQIEAAAQWAEKHEAQIEAADQWAEKHEAQIEAAAARAERIIEQHARRLERRADEAQIEAAAQWAEKHEAQIEAAEQRAEKHEAQIEAAAARAERIIERQARRLERRAERAAQHQEKTLAHHQATEALDAFSPLISRYLGKEQTDQLTGCLQNAAPSGDARRTEICAANTPDEYADQIISLLYASVDAADPVVGRFKEIRRALRDQDYAALNEFSALLDEHIGPHWLEEYAELCTNGEVPDDFESQISMAVTQHNWRWIEDHAHLITDPEIIRRITLVSASAGFFDLIQLFIDQLDQPTIDYAARQAVRLGCTDDIYSFAGRVSRGILSE